MKLTKTAFPIAAATLSALLFMSSLQAAGTLKVGRGQDSVHMDPILVSQNADIWILNNIHALLVRNNREATGVVPDLAESWQISEDGLTYTFTLREGLKFSDGTTLKSSDVKFSIERLRDDEASVFSTMFAIIDNIQMPDDRTIVFILAEPRAPFLSFLALFAAAILPEDQLINDYDSFLNSPTGAGAFRIADWRRGDKLVLEKNEHYWEEGLPVLDSVEWHYEPDDSTRMQKLQTGELDAMIFVPFNRIEELNKNVDINVHIDASSRMDHILINHTHEPLHDYRVRRALNMAIDVDSIVNAVTFGYGTPANSYIPASGMFYNKDNPRYEFNPEAALKLLDEAGVEDLELDIIVQDGNANYEQIGVMVQDQLRNIGVTVNIIRQEPGQSWESIVEGDYDLSINYWTNDIIDPDEKTGFVLNGNDPEVLSFYTRYNNPLVNELIVKGQTELDPEKRRAIYKEIQELAKHDVHWIDLYYSPFHNASWNYVDGFFQNPMGRFMLEDTTISRQ